MNNPKISVIVPVYNVERYLPRCINSLLAQSYTNFEILLIDDGSKDSSGKICDEYAEKDGRIRVFHKENRGVSSARNLGLDKAEGGWIAFCDSDDWVENEWLEAFVLCGDYDFIVQGYYVKGGKEGSNEIFRKLPSMKGRDKNISDPIRILYLNLNNGFLWCKLFKKDIIKKNCIYFNERYKIREDEHFMYNYLSNVESYCFSSKGFYHYTEPLYAKKYQNISFFDKFECVYEIIDIQFEIFNQTIKKEPIVKSNIQYLILSFVAFFQNNNKAIDIDKIIPYVERLKEIVDYTSYIPHTFKERLFMYTCIFTMSSKKTVKLNYLIWKLLRFL